MGTDGVIGAETTQRFNAGAALREIVFAVDFEKTKSRRSLHDRPHMDGAQTDANRCSA